MSKLTLEDAISHCLEVAEARETEVLKYNYCRGIPDVEKVVSDCKECAADHRQLAEWLTELKHLKAIIAGYGTVDMQKLDMILTMIRTESEDAWTRIEREKELAEAKRLLKLTVGTNYSLYKSCSNCSHFTSDCNCDIGKYLYGTDEKECEWEWKYMSEIINFLHD